MFGWLKRQLADTAIAESKWPLADGSEYVISAEAVDWEMTSGGRLDVCYFAELHRLVKLDRLRVVTLCDAKECYLRALHKLAAEIAEEIRVDDERQVAEGND